MAVGTTETWGHLNEVLSATIHGDRRAARRARRALRPRLRDGYVEVGPDRMRPARRRPKSVVCASGNLAHVYLSALPGRVPLDVVRAAHPGSDQGLVDAPGHPVRDGHAPTAGPVVLGRHGATSLVDGTVVGDRTRCGGSGPTRSLPLRRLDAFPHSGDLILNGAVGRDGSVAAFEDLVGSHGGLGGPQSEAFLVVPETWDVPDRLANGIAVHEVLARTRCRRRGVNGRRESLSPYPSAHFIRRMR